MFSHISHNFKASTTFVIERASSLDCLEETFAELSTSFTTFQQNFQCIKQVHESLKEFNKAFSGFLYGIKMNAHCVEFPEAPTKETFASFIQRRDAELLTPTPISKIKTPTPISKIKAPTPLPPKKKKINKALLIKKLIKKIADSLPSKYRDQHQNRKNVELILRLLCDNPAEGKYLQDIVKCTELPRGRCIEYLNVLINAEHIVKLSHKGILYKLIQ
ncbi:DASH complex subunit Dam1-domain-containing protein [Gigaspora rosea]|uniref:DASH complex subunit DAM1 n=1 Tax=Gigaspora rosea TaxID=44941 RepID=A0A397U9B2_9GLOM|nr:DASH complex subunit Dam1-domain-containing protein [Gigaspora rosea]